MAIGISRASIDNVRGNADSAGMETSAPTYYLAASIIAGRVIIHTYEHGDRIGTLDAIRRAVRVLRAAGYRRTMRSPWKVL
jgi:hypothetical protein